MKKFKLLSLLFLVLSLGFVACGPEPEKPPISEDKGEGTETSPYSVAGAMENQGAKDNTDYKWVKGYIVGIWEGKDAEGNDIYPNNFAKFEAPFYTNVNILLADSQDETSETKLFCVQLPVGEVRNLLNLVDNAGNLKKEVLLYGTLENYNKLSGMKNTKYFELEGGITGGTKPGTGETGEGNGTEASPYNVASAIANQGAKDNTDYKWVKGYIVGIWEGKDANGNDLYPNNFAKFEPPFYTNVNILIADSKDETDLAQLLCVQLPVGEVRNLLNLVDKADNLQKQVVLCGALEAYNSMAGMKNTKYFELEGGITGGTKPGTGTGDGGTEDNPYNIADAMANQGAKDNTDYKWVKGHIVGIWEGKDANGNDLYPNNFAKFEPPFYTNVNILIADSKDETDPAQLLCVQLPAGEVRNLLNLVDKTDNLKKQVVLYGALEAYNSMAGMKNTKYFELEGGVTGGTKPGESSDAIFSETLLTQDSFDKFTSYSVSGDLTWKFDAKYGAVMSGYDTKSNANEDWFFTPAIDLSGKSNVTLTFDHARGPAASINVGIAEGYYTVWISNDYNSGAPSTATWTQIEGVNYGNTAWGYVSSGNLSIPAANLKANAKIAFKYLCTDAESATWEIKNVVVK